MRWLLALSLAACSSTVTEYDRMTERTEPALVAALRRARGSTAVELGDRSYVDWDGALGPAVTAFTTATADAVAAGKVSYPEPPGSRSGEERGIGGKWHPDGVYAVTRTERVVSVGTVMISSLRADDDSRLYCACAKVARRQYVWTCVRATPAIDAAWERLVRDARRAARTTVVVPFVGTRPHDFIRNLEEDGIDAVPVNVRLPD